MSEIADEEAFSILFHRHSRMLCTYVMRMVGDYDDTQDIVQETFAKAYDWFATISTFDEAALRMWLLRVATNHTYTYFRQKKRKALLGGRLSIFLQQTQMTQEDLEAQSATVEYVQRMLQKLPPKQRACYLLYLQGYTCEEIAIMVGKKSHTVTADLSRARQRLRALGEQRTQSIHQRTAIPSGRRLDS